MATRNIHRIIGLALLLPILGWIITAMIFYIKPGYAGAYELLEAKTYPLRERLTAAEMDSTWLELKYMKTILGTHLIVRTKDGVLQLDPETLLPKEKPGDEKIRMLLNDAFSSNPNRYGEVATISHDTIITSTNIRIMFDWNGLSMYQRGEDTDRIDMLYKIHYLQWTGVKTIDRILGPLGLGLVFVLSMLGIRLAVRKK